MSPCSFSRSSRPQGSPPLRLEDFLVSVPRPCHIPAGFPNSLGLLLPEGPACQEKGHPLFRTSPRLSPDNTQESWS